MAKASYAELLREMAKAVRSEAQCSDRPGSLRLLEDIADTMGKLADRWPAADVYVVESLGPHGSQVRGVYATLEAAQHDYPGDWSPVGSENWERPRVAQIKYWISRRSLRGAYVG